jgi:hypothetical protein
MTVYIHKTDSPEEIERKMARLVRSKSKHPRQKSFDPFKFVGKGIFKGIDGLDYQKKVRNGWK